MLVGKESMSAEDQIIVYYITNTYNCKILFICLGYFTLVQSFL